MTGSMHLSTYLMSRALNLQLVSLSFWRQRRPWHLERGGAVGLMAGRHSVGGMIISGQPGGDTGGASAS